MSGDEFCPDCDVREDMHDRDLYDQPGEACRQAAAFADRLASMERLMFGGFR